jgi:hypothetical protein
MENDELVKNHKEVLSQLDILQKQNADEKAARLLAEQKVSKVEDTLEHIKKTQSENTMETVLATIEAVKKTDSEKLRADTIENELLKISSEEDRDKVRASLDKVNETDPITKVELAKSIALGKELTEAAKKAIEASQKSGVYYVKPNADKESGEGSATTKRDTSKYGESVLPYVNDDTIKRINSRLPSHRQLKDFDKFLERQKYKSLPKNNS